MAGRILIVDADPATRTMLQSRLMGALYDPQIATSAADCLRQIAERMPDLLILDSQLPDVTGVEVLHGLRADPATRDLPLILTHGADDLPTRRLALWLGADDVMARPLDESRLMARMRALLRTRDRAEELRARNATLGALGLAEGASPFERPPLIACVTGLAEGALQRRDALLALQKGPVTLLSRDEALAEAGPAPDAYLIEADRGAEGDGLALISDLRSRGASRHAAICLILPTGRAEDAAMAFDLGANDVVTTETDAHEIGLRLSRLVQRKLSEDRLRDTVNNGLRLAVIDPLTGLHNRRYALPQLGRMLRALPVDDRMAVMAIDLDRFKSVNDRFGHAAGDTVLVEVARRLKANLRSDDLVARIGGEEFLVALPATGLAEANLLAERLCRAIEEEPIIIDNQRSVAITVSIGLAATDATSAPEADAVATLMARADSALLHSKARGRNQVTVNRPAA